MAKQATSIRLSAEGKQLLADLAAKLGIAQAAVIEVALRHLSKHEILAGRHLDEGTDAR